MSPVIMALNNMQFSSKENWSSWYITKLKCSSIDLFASHDFFSDDKKGTYAHDGISKRGYAPSTYPSWSGKIPHKAELIADP